MSLVSELRHGKVSKFSERGFGFVCDGSEKFFFHRSRYHTVRPAVDNTQKEPWLSTATPPRDPQEGDMLVFWPEKDWDEGNEPTQPVEAWTFPEVWNPALVNSQANMKALKAVEERERQELFGGGGATTGFMTEEDLIKGLEGLVDPIASQKVVEKHD